tara:strand:- start:201 stop:422 length:222 start_codon:yes stop_codon:yes gene_type:complete
MIFDDSVFDEPISVISVFGEIVLLISRISFLYSLVDVQTITKFEFAKPSFSDLTIIPVNLSLFILEIFDFDFS